MEEIPFLKMMSWGPNESHGVMSGYKPYQSEQLVTGNHTACYGQIDVPDQPYQINPQL